MMITQRDTEAAQVAIEAARRYEISTPTLVVIIRGIAGLGDEVPLYDSWRALANAVGPLLVVTNPVAVIAEIERLCQ